VTFPTEKFIGEQKNAKITLTKAACCAKMMPSFLKNLFGSYGVFYEVHSIRHILFLLLLLFQSKRNLCCLKNLFT